MLQILRRIEEFARRESRPIRVRPPKRSWRVLVSSPLASILPDDSRIRRRHFGARMNRASQARPDGKSAESRNPSYVRSSLTLPGSIKAVSWAWPRSRSG